MLSVDEILAAGERRYDDDGKPISDIATCGHCGRSWDDALITSLTPAPSGRCPFEYEHKYPRHVVELTDRGFVVVDNETDEVVRGAFYARHKAREVADELNRD